MDRKNLIALALVLGLGSCSSDSGELESINVYHNNITIISDLTNRLNESKPLHDTVVINQIIDAIWSPDFLYQNRKLGHEDRMAFLRMGNKSSWASSENEINLIDLGDFGDDHYNRNRYIKGLNTNSNNNLDSDKAKLKKTIAYQYKNRSTSGGYLMGLLNDLDEDYLHPNKFLKGDSTSQVFHFVKDVLIIFTDGYIEFGQYGPGKNSLSRKQVGEIRNEMKKEGISATEASKNLGYEIKPITNDGLKGTEVILLETNDLSYRNGNPLFQPDDRTIYTGIWTDWLKRSGAKSVTVKQPFSTKSEVTQFIYKMLY